MVKYWVMVLVLSASNQIFADGADIHIVGGISLADLGGTQYLSLGDITNQFNTSSQETLSPFVGFGVGYQWDRPISSLPMAFNLGITGYYVSNTITGTEIPTVNYVPGDPLNYTVNENSLAWMLEPKFIYTGWSWQPYFIGGIGVSANTASGYTETPASNSQPNVTANNYANQTNTELAWELGFGAQHTVYTSQTGGQLIVGLEYRYMNWGLVSLGKTASQTTNQGPSFGDLETNLIDATLRWQF